MNFEIYIATRSLRDLIKNAVEQNIMVRDIGMSGLLENVPFFTSLADLAGGDFSIVTAAIDHIRVNNVQVIGGGVDEDSPVSVNVNVPPSFSLFGPDRPAESLSIRIQPPRVSSIFDVYLVKKSDMQLANGNAIPLANTMVVQFKANFIIPPLNIAGAALSISPVVKDIELGIFGIFFRLPPAAEREGLDRAAALTLFRRYNRVLGSFSDGVVEQLYDFMLDINRTGVLERIVLPAIPLNISGINSILSSLPGPSGVLRIWNAGLFVDNNRVTIRLQAEPAGVTDNPFSIVSKRNVWLMEWQNFYARGSGNRLGENDWGVNVPADILINNFHKNIIDGVAADSRITMSAGGNPRSEWEVVGGSADSEGPCRAGSTIRITTRFAIFVPEVCFPWGLGVDANVQLTTDLSILANGNLRADLHVDFGVDDGDLALCSILNAWIFSSGAFVIGGVFGGFIGAAIAAAIGGLAGGITTLAIGYTYDPGALSLGGGLIPVPGSDNDFYMEFQINADLSLTNARMEINELAGCSDGLCLRGEILVLGMELLLAGDLNEWNPFSWSATGLCNSESMIRASAFAQWPLERTRAGFANMQLQLFNFAVLSANPELHQSFRPMTQLEHSVGMVLTLSTDAWRAIRMTEQAAVTEDPYLEIFIQTNVGARIIKFNAFDGSLSAASRDEFVETQRRLCALSDLRRITAQVNRLVRMLDWTGSKQRNLTIRPVKNARVMSMWTIMANNLQQGETLQISRTDKLTDKPDLKPVYQFQPNTRKNTIAARVIEFVHKEDSHLVMQIISSAGKGQKKNAQDGMLVLNWQYFYETARIHYAGICLDVAVNRVNGRRYIAVLSTSGLAVYNAETLAQPRLKYADLLPGMQQLDWSGDTLKLKGTHCQLGYHPDINHLHAEEENPSDQPQSCWLPKKSFSVQAHSISTDKNKPFSLSRDQSGHRNMIIDEYGEEHYIVSLDKVTLTYNDREPFVSLYYCHDRKLPDLKPDTETQVIQSKHAEYQRPKETKRSPLKGVRAL